MVSTFMNDGDHFDSFHYARQMALYTDVVKFYLQDSKDINIKDWTFDCKMCVVNTSKSNALKQYSACFNVSEERLKQGREEYERLIKTVGYYMITENRKL